ncbi:MAG: lipase maturation factor family protein [Deltaproteobacteria bacterium]|nr:lipase maturation factor family protein [Deltaproteobacteria bacterium]
MNAAWVAKLLVERSLAAIFFIGFVVAHNQFRPLCGERGLTPIGDFLSRTRFREAPSLFFFARTDRAFAWTARVGIILSLLTLVGAPDQLGVAAYMLTWFAMWALYLSFVNAGQIFYGFGWETMLLECGVLAIFLGPSTTAAPMPVLWLYRWLLFRLMFGAGLIKLRGDACWRDLTCMYFHYETQPLPNPLSRGFHFLPKPVHRASVLFTHFVELVVPFLYFAPQPFRGVAGALTILFQLLLILSGNLSWLNWLTVAVAFSCMDVPQLGMDGALPDALPSAVIWALVVFVALKSVRPTLNLLAREQMMNASFDPLHLVNTYGAFGAITRERREIILEGTLDAIDTPASEWREYHFKAKPGALAKRGPWIAPYHLRLDWLMWFAAMSGPWSHPWIVDLVKRLLQNDRATLALMGPNPFPDAPPRRIRAMLYAYRFTPSGDPSGHIWERRLIGPYLRPVSLEDDLFTALRGAEA